MVNQQQRMGHCGLLFTRQSRLIRLITRRGGGGVVRISKTAAFDNDIRAYESDPVFIQTDPLLIFLLEDVYECDSILLSLSFLPDLLIHSIEIPCEYPRTRAEAGC